MVEQGINYSIEHQAWSHVQRFGQQQTQRTTRLVYLTMINRLIVNALRIKQSAMPYALGVLQNPASENLNLDADQEYETSIRKISPQALRSTVIVQYIDVIMDVR